MRRRRRRRRGIPHWIGPQWTQRCCYCGAQLGYADWQQARVIGAGGPRGMVVLCLGHALAAQPEADQATRRLAEDVAELLRRLDRQAGGSRLPWRLAQWVYGASTTT